MRMIDADALYEELNNIGGCGAEEGTYFAGWDDAITEAIRLLDDATVMEVRKNTGESKMTKYENDCGVLIHAEMQHGIAEHGLFHSPHEGLAVIMEEFEELQDAAEEVEEAFQNLKWSVFDDDLKTSIEDAKNIAAKAKHTMIEAMQVATMAQKYIKTFKN